MARPLQSPIWGGLSVLVCDVSSLVTSDFYRIPDSFSVKTRESSLPHSPPQRGANAGPAIRPSFVLREVLLGGWLLTKKSLQLNLPIFSLTWVSLEASGLRGGSFRAGHFSSGFQSVSSLVAEKQEDSLS